MALDPYGPCPCGSGQKYKFCCRPKDLEAMRLARSQGREVDIFRAGDKAIIVSAEVALRLEELRSRVSEAIAKGDAAEARRLCERMIDLCPAYPPAHNNLALACYIEADFERAVQICRRVLAEIDGRNAFARGTLIHLYILLGRNQDAEGEGDALEKLPALDESAVVKKCEGLARLRRHSAVMAAFRKGERFLDEERALATYLAGLAAANLADYETASALLEKSLRLDASFDMAQRALDRLKRGRAPGTVDGDWPYFDVPLWVPPALWERLLEKAKSEEGNVIDEASRYPGILEAFKCVVNEGDESAVAVVRLLGSFRTPEAASLLGRVAFGTFGTDSLRTQALMSLREMGELAEGDKVKLFHKGGWREVSIQMTELGGEDTQFPQELAPLMAAGAEAAREENHPETESIARRVIQLAPNHPKGYICLAASLRAQKRMDECEAAVLKAVEVAPDSLMAGAFLIELRLEQKRLDEARELLKREMPERSSLQAFAAFMLASARVHMAADELERAWECLKSVEAIDKDLPLLKKIRREFGDIRDYVEELGIRRQEFAQRQRLRLISEAPPLAEALGRYTVDQLTMIARHAGVPRTTGLRKAEILALVADKLSSGTDALANLEEQERGAIARLRQCGWRADFDGFSRDIGDDADAWVPGRPQSILGRLLQKGLVVVGTVGGTVSVVVPLELRSLLGESAT